tara:strand:- start:10763 stop:15379 length:4617 start_codon:yes stop_codon:yes gene_type:complete
MYKLQLRKPINSCLDIEEIINNNWQLVENYDGTVSLFDDVLANLSSIIETKPCCETLGYTFDLETQKCRWGGDKSLCDVLGNDPFKLVLNPNNDGGVLFNFDVNETCFFDISFDYLFKFDCEDILKVIKGVKGQTNLENNVAIKKISGEITNTENDIIVLTQQIRVENKYDIPYVIQCVNSTTTNSETYYNKDGQIKTVTNNQKDAYDSENTKSAFIKKTPPGAYGVKGGSITNYCLTQAGLSVWRTILGDETYDKWFQSNGIDTSLYTCLEVEQLVNQNTTQGGLIETKCDYSLYDKDISLKKISELEAKLTDANDEKNSLTAKRGGLEMENTEDLPNSCELLSIFEDFSVEFTLETLNPITNKLETVYSEPIMNIGVGNLYNYIVSTSGDTGLLISGFSSCESGQESASTPPKCIELKDLLYDAIYLNRFLPFNKAPSNQEESIKLFNELNCWYRQKCWLNYVTRIQGDIINQLNGKDVNMSIKINNSCADFSVLLDRIKINKDCTKINNVEKLISEPPKFEIERVVDNKKSWVANDFRDDRVFELKYRGTEYDVNHHKLIINTKEVDLNLSPARAVEQDVWCYINQNNCILEGCDDSFSAFTCPSGYTLTSDADACIFTATTVPATSITQYNVSTPFNFTRFNHYLNRGTLFVEDVTDKEWPIFWTGTPQNVWVGPYYNVDYLTASNGDYLDHSGFGDKTTDSGYLIWSSPDAFCAEFSEFGSSSSDLFNSKLNPNILWGGTAGDVSSSVFNNITGTGVGGRLYNRSIWTDSQSPLDEWIGLSYSFELDETKVYRIGFAADEKVRIKVNGEYLINSDLTPDHPINPRVNLFNSASRFQQIYVVVGLTLLAGKNIIEAEGWNSQNAAGFVCEVYDATESELRGIRYETELSGVTVFSTRSEIGSVFQLGQNSGNSCPTGYSLDTSTSAPYQCIDIDKISRSDNQKNCCCPGFPLLIKGDDGITVELPLTGATGTTLDCSQIQTLVDSFSVTGTTVINTLETLKCGNVYSLYSPICNSLSLDGMDDFIQAPINAAYDLDKEDVMSFECWIKFDSLGVFNQFFTKYVSSQGILFTVSLGELRLDLQNNGGLDGLIVQSTGAAIIAGVWYHLAATYDGSESPTGIKLYKNGVLLTNGAPISNTLTGTITNAANVQIGRVGTFYTDIIINTARWWNAELTAAEVLTQYNNRTGTPVQDASLIFNTDIQNSTWNGSEFYIPDDTGITTGYTTVNMGLNALVQDCPDISNSNFVFSEENDGIFGVYKATILTGGTDTYVNVSDKVTSECCEIINSGFESYSNIFKQGVNDYPTVNWDPNKERCVYVKCGDDGCTNFDTLLTTELTEIDTVLEFGSVLSNELIDAKSRQTISGYPALRMLYDRYNLHSLDYCNVDSSRFDYFDMDNFGNSVGDYWIDLIEQVVPATTIWGSTYTYRNTIFDQQKYKYRQNNLYFCNDPSVNFPFSAISKDSSVSVETFNITLTEINTGNTITTVSKELTTRNCDGVWIMQSTCNPEFLGTVSIIGRTGTNNQTTINETPTKTG